MIRQYLKKSKDGFLRYIPYIGGLIGSLTFAFSTSFWFNAVEAEVYAFSTFLVAAITYLILRWMERADKPDSEKYPILWPDYPI